MKKLLSTTALALILGLPSLALAQTPPRATAPVAQTQSMDAPGFLVAREKSDIFASKLMGHDVYAPRADANRASTEGRTAPARDGTPDMDRMNRADLEKMDKIGQINEIVLSHDGKVRAIVIGVGGFLGMGEKDVAVKMDQVTFATDSDDRSQMYVVVNTGVDMLKDSPSYERTPMTDSRADASATDRRADAPATDRRAAASATDRKAAAPATDRRADASATDRKAAASPGDRAALTRPEIAREGYNRVEMTKVSTDMLVGKSVFDLDEKSVGTVDDLILDGSGAITNVIINFGGFLGIGTSQVSLGFDELTILSNEGNTSVRIYVDASKETIQALPQYSSTK